MYFRKLKEKSGIKQNPICWPIYDRFVLITVSDSIKMLYAIFLFRGSEAGKFGNLEETESHCWPILALKVNMLWLIWSVKIKRVSSLYTKLNCCEVKQEKKVKTHK